MRALHRAGLDRRRSPVFIQSFEQSNLKRLNRMIDVRLIQLVDANDVNPDGTLDYTAPFDRPYDWTVSGNPVLTSRTFGFFATDAGLDEIRTYADGIGPWKRYIVSTEAVDSNGDGRRGRERRRQRRRGRPRPAPADRPDPASARARAARPHVDVPQRAEAAGGGLRGIPVEEYLQFYELGIDGVFADFPGHRADGAGAHGPAGGVGLRR